MAVTELDEYMAHQTVATFDQVSNTDPQWTERVWFSAFDKSGGHQLVFGFGKYHNRNVMDGSIGLVVDHSVQYNVRASRELLPAPDTYRIGPLGYEIVEPLRRVRVLAESNESGFSCDVRFIGETEIYEQRPPMFRRRKGRTINHMIRYFQTGSLEGWIEVEGERREVNRDEWWAARDRSWGLRSNTGERTSASGESASELGGLEPPGEGIAYRWNFFTLQFDDWNTSFEFAQTPDGHRLGPALGHLQHAAHLERPPQKIVHVDHEWDFTPGTERLRGIHSVIHLDDGTVKEIDMEPISVAFRRPGGGHYGGYNDWVQGVWMGGQRVEGDRIELSDDVIGDLHNVEDYALKVRCGDALGWGVAEPMIPGIAELLTTD
jgi:hypothetical protein